jgi:putative ABC transport system ATP-binding protein
MNDKKKKDIIIELKDVWKIYEMGAVRVPALQGLDMKVEKGAFVSVMGPSGSGKSTAMNMIGCLDIPTKGEIYLDGQNIANLHESDLAQIRGKKIGFIFQKFNLINSLSALENVMLPMIFQDKNLDERIKKAKELLKLVELANRMHHKPNELSGGQQQRVAIARALANNPEVVLADEPTGNLDSKSGENVMGFIKKLHEKEGKTIIVVTHSEDIAKMADRMCILKDGKILKEHCLIRGGRK